MPFDIGSRELLIIAALIVFLFGAKKIPEFGKMFADGIRTLRSGFKDEPVAQAVSKK